MTVTLVFLGLGALCLAAAIFRSITKEYMMDDGAQIIFGAVGSVLLIVGIGCLLWWFSADSKRQVINQKYGTNYTTEQMFWSYSTIEKMIEGKRYRIDVNSKAEKEGR